MDESGIDGDKANEIKTNSILQKIKYNFQGY